MPTATLVSDETAWSAKPQLIRLAAARQLKELHSAYESVKDLIPLGGYMPGADPKTDRAVQMAPAIQRFLRQDVNESAEFQASVAALLSLVKAS